MDDNKERGSVHIKMEFTAKRDGEDMMIEGVLTIQRVTADGVTLILSGDVMQIIAYEYMCRVPEKELMRVLTAFSKMGKEICEGQQYDME